MGPFSDAKYERLSEKSHSWKTKCEITSEHY